MKKPYEIFELGLIDYAEALAFQKNIFDKVYEGRLKAGLIFCSHYPVITRGRSSRKDSLLSSPAELSVKNIPVYEAERGGDVTYHGPGQLMVYPIINLSYFKKDIHFYLRSLEEAVLKVTSGYGIDAQRIAGKTGAWVGAQKIASIGISVRRWISFHGAAINIKKDDLDNFTLIKPCGMDIMMTSMESILGEKIEISSIKDKIIREDLI